MLRNKTTLSLLVAGIALQACVTAFPVATGPAPGAGPVIPAPAPAAATLPPAEFVALTLVDGSPGLGLWCELRRDCVEAARLLCDNRQSIRAEFDIDRASPGAASFFARSDDAPVRMTVSCPV